MPTLCRTKKSVERLKKALIDRASVFDDGFALDIRSGIAQVTTGRLTIRTPIDHADARIVTGTVSADTLDTRLMIMDRLLGGLSTSVSSPISVDFDEIKRAYKGAGISHTPPAPKPIALPIFGYHLTKKTNSKCHEQLAEWSSDYHKTEFIANANRLVISPLGPVPFDCPLDFSFPCIHENYANFRVNTHAFAAAITLPIDGDTVLVRISDESDIAEIRIGETVAILPLQS